MALTIDQIRQGTREVALSARAVRVTSARLAMTAHHAIGRVEKRVFEALLLRLNWDEGWTNEVSVGDIAAATGREPTAVANALDRLEQHGHIVRERAVIGEGAYHFALIAMPLPAAPPTGPVVIASRLTRVAPATPQNDPTGMRLDLTEDQTQHAVMAHLKVRARHGLFWFAVPNGGWRTKAEAGVFSATGVVAGVPDIILIFGGHVYGLEIKKQGGRLSPVQIKAHAAMISAGAIIATADGLTDALLILEHWGMLRGTGRLAQPPIPGANPY